MTANSLSDWLDELNCSEKHVKPYLESWREDMLSYTGRAYKAGKGRVAPENHALEWAALMRGQLLMGNPAVRWTSQLEGDPQARARALTMATNQVSKRLMLKNVNEQLLMDFGFKYAVCLVKNEPAPGFTDSRSTPRWPAVYRISPTRFRFDPAADRVDSRTWSAHLIIGSRKELMKRTDGGWNRDALKKVEKQNVKKFRDTDTKIPERDELAYWEIHCFEDHDDSPGSKKGYHGTIYTVADGQSAESGWIRDPYPAFVPPWGPYIVGGDYMVPDDSIHMGPITAASQQSHYLNRTKRATIAAIEAYKRLVFVSDPKVADAIKDGTNDWVYSIEQQDIRTAVTVSEVGGATQQHFAAEESAQRSLDKVSGITERMRGYVDPSATATADSIAAQSASGRTSGTVAKFYDVVSRYLYTIGYFIDIDDEVEIELGPQAAGMFVDAKGNPTTKLKGGRHPTQDPEEFFNLDLELRVGSMERSLEMDTQMQLQVMQQTMQEVATLGPASALFTDWQAYLDAKAELTGIPALARLVNVPALQTVAAAMLGQQGSPPGQASQPKQSFAGNKGAPSGNGAAAKIGSASKTLDAPVKAAY